MVKRWMMNRVLMMICMVAGMSAKGQSSRYLVAPGEYLCYILDNHTHTLYTVTTGILRPVEGLPHTIRTADAGAHHGLAVDQEGAVWAWETNQNGECGTGSIGGDVDMPRKI